MVTSRLFALSLFNMGLISSEIQRFLPYKLFCIVLFENVPQLLICIALTVLTNDEITLPVLLSFTGSLFSIIAALVEFCKNYELHSVELNWCLEFEFDTDSTLSSPDVSRVEFGKLVKRNGLFKLKLMKLLANCIDMEQNHIEIRNIELASPHGRIQGVIFKTESKIRENLLESARIGKNLSSSTSLQDDVKSNSQQTVSINKDRLKYLHQWELKSMSGCEYKNDTDRDDNGKTVTLTVGSCYDLLLQTAKFENLIAANNALKMRECICQFVFETEEHIQMCLNEIKMIQLSYFRQSFQNKDLIQMYDKNSLKNRNMDTKDTMNYDIMNNRNNINMSNSNVNGGVDFINANDFGPAILTTMGQWANGNQNIRIQVSSDAVQVIGSHSTSDNIGVSNGHVTQSSFASSANHVDGEEKGNKSEANSTNSSSKIHMQNIVHNNMRNFDAITNNVDHDAVHVADMQLQ